MDRLLHILVRRSLLFFVRAKLQSCIALASRDAEAIAAVFVKKLHGFNTMLTELGVNTYLPSTLRVDNKASVDGAFGSKKLSKESRFMAMRLLWLRDMVRNSLVRIRRVTNYCCLS